MKGVSSLDLVEGTHYCGRCKCTKALTDFYKNQANPNGYQHICIECSKWWASTPKGLESRRLRTAYNYKKNREQVMERRRSDDAAIRLMALQKVSGLTIPCCACCNENEIKFLALDHKYNNGNIERRENPKAQKLPRWLKKNNYANLDQYQVLCYNCNMAKAFYKQCPHTAKLPEDLQ